MEGIPLRPTHYRSDGFLIRAYREGDGEPLYKSVQASREHLRPFIPWARQDIDFETTVRTVGEIIGRWERGEDYTVGIWDEEELIGGTGFHLRVGGPETGNAEIGMWINFEHAGRGLGTKVLAAMLDWGFTEWGWQRLVWKCDVRNEGSIRVAQKNGLVLEGTFRSDHIANDGSRADTHVFAILRSEWEARRLPK